MRVAFQGEPGAYSEQAVYEAAPDAESVPAPLLVDAFQLVADGRADLAVVPVENSQAGSIHDTYDLLHEYGGRLWVQGEYELRVRHCLLAPPGAALSGVRRAYSHPQALAQTAGWLRARGIQPAAYHDTAGAARWVAEQGDLEAAAVASRRAAEVYGLQVLAEGIEDNPTNRTRFVVIGPGPHPLWSEPGAGEGKTSFVFSTANRPGALYDALGALASRGVNLLKLESRPSRGEGWEYLFYVDCEGWSTDAPVAEALSALGWSTGWVKVLGSYPRATAARS